MITDAQILEFVEAVAGDEAMLLPVMPPWWRALSDAEQDEVMMRAELAGAARLQAVIDRCNDKK